MENGWSETNTPNQFSGNPDGGVLRGLHFNLIAILSIVVAVIFLVMSFVIWRGFFVAYETGGDIFESNSRAINSELDKSVELAKVETGVPSNKDLLQIMQYQDWEIFVDEQYKFQLQYPKGFAVVRQAVGANDDTVEYQRLFVGAGDQINPPFATNGIGMTVLLFKTDKSFDEIIQVVTDQFLGSEAVLSDYEIEDGVVGKQLEFVTPDKQKVIQRYFKAHLDNYYYEVKVIVDGESFESTARKMVNTFRIAK